MSEISGERGPSGEVSPIPFTVGYTALLLVNSFRFAQGDSERQPWILQYLALKFRPQFSSDVIRQAVEPATTTAVDVIVSNMQHKRIYTKDESKKYRFDDQIGTMQGYADDLIEFVEAEPALLQNSFQMDELVTLIIEGDANYLGVAEKPVRHQRIRASGGPQNTFTDPHFSFWTHYGVRGNRGPELPYEYGMMFTDMVADFNANDGYNEELRRMAHAVEQTYNQRHP